MKNIIFLTLLLVSIQAMASFSYDFGNKDPKNAAFTTRWTVDITERKVIDGALHGVATGEDAHFAPVKVNLPLAKASIAIIEMMADEGAGCIQLFFNIGEPSSSFREQKLITDGKFHTYTFDLEKMPRLRNAGQVKTFRLDPCTGKGKHAFAIRSIRLVPRHKLLTDLALVVPKVPKKLIVPSFFQHPDGGPAVVPTSLELSYTDEAFIIDYESALNNVSYVAGSQKDGPVYDDDCIDITFSFSKESYYQFVFNPKGTTFDQKVTYQKYMPAGLSRNTPLGYGETSWDARSEIKTYITPGRWSGRAVIFWKSFGFEAPPPSFKFNIGRYSKADGKGFSSFSYSPIFRFALPENLRTVYLGKTPSAVVSTEPKESILPGKNTIIFNNPNKRELECCVTVRDLKTGKEQNYSSKASTGKIPVLCDLGESEYELLLTALENGLTLYFDARAADTSVLRRKFKAAFGIVRGWSSRGSFADRKSHLEKRGKEIYSQNPPNYAAIADYIEEVQHINRDFRVEKLLRETQANFKRNDIPFAIAEASSADKIFHSLDTGVPAFAGRSSNSLEIEGAKNEVEGIQLVLLGVKTPVKGLNLRLASAPSEKAPVITFHGVDFLDTSKALDTRYVTPFKGEWPEVLVNEIPGSLAPREIRSIWINAEIAADVPAGIYKYQLELSADGISPVRIPLSVKVWNFALPVVPTLRTAMSSFEAFILGYYAKFRKTRFTAEERKTVTDTLVRFMLKHRMNPGYIYTMTAFSGNLIKYPAMDRLAEYRKLGLNAVPVGQFPMCGFISTADEMMAKCYTEDKLKNFMRAMEKVAKQGKHQNLDNIFYIHSFDEIYAATHKKEKIKKLRTIRERLRSIAPKIKVECITRVEPELIGIVDIWCPSISMMSKNPKSFWDRQKAGEELWLYTCLGAPGRESGLPPSFVLEESAAAMRLIGWICYFYKAEGFLYWAITRWNRNGFKGGKTYPEEPWNPQYLSGYNGESCFIYPARSFDMEPLSSIRLENLRDGFEDYEYLTLLAKAYKTKKKLLSREECKEIEDLLSMKELVRSGSNYTDDSGKILGHRRKIAKWIEKLNPNPRKYSIASEGKK